MALAVVLAVLGGAYEVAGFGGCAVVLVVLAVGLRAGLRAMGAGGRR